MKIKDSLIKFVLPKVVKKITISLIESLGLNRVGDEEYIIENQKLFEENFWLFLSDSVKLELLLSEQIKHRSDIDELKNEVRLLEDRLDNITITYRKKEDDYY
jgi:hypothetical protein